MLKANKRPPGVTNGAQYATGQTLAQGILLLFMAVVLGWIGSYIIKSLSGRLQNSDFADNVHLAVQEATDFAELAQGENVTLFIQYMGLTFREEDGILTLTNRSKQLGEDLMEAQRNGITILSVAPSASGNGMIVSYFSQDEAYGRQFAEYLTESNIFTAYEYTYTTQEFGYNFIIYLEND